jgi:hypothetical protein
VCYHSQKDVNCIVASFDHHVFCHLASKAKGMLVISSCALLPFATVNP